MARIGEADNHFATVFGNDCRFRLSPKKRRTAAAGGYRLYGTRSRVFAADIRRVHEKDWYRGAHEVRCGIDQDRPIDGSDYQRASTATLRFVLEQRSHQYD